MCFVFAVLAVHTLLTIVACSEVDRVYPVETKQSSTFIYPNLTLESASAFDDNITTSAHTVRSASGGWIYGRFSELICPYNITVINGKPNEYLRWLNGVNIILEGRNVPFFSFFFINCWM